MSIFLFRHKDRMNNKGRMSLRVIDYLRNDEILYGLRIMYFRESERPFRIYVVFLRPSSPFGLRSGYASASEHLFEVPYFFRSSLLSSGFARAPLLHPSDSSFAGCESINFPEPSSFRDECSGRGRCSSKNLFRFELGLVLDRRGSLKRKDISMATSS